MNFNVVRFTEKRGLELKRRLQKAAKFDFSLEASPLTTKSRGVAARDGHRVTSHVQIALANEFHQPIDSAAAV